jgi:hypothetical protein
MKLNILLLSLFVLVIGRSKTYAQQEIAFKDLKLMEDSLIRTADSMFHTPIPDLRTGFCQQFVAQLVRALKAEGSYKYPFDSLRKMVNIISPEDNSFRIFNWPIAYSEVRTRYYGAIQMNSNSLQLYPLIDNSDMLTKVDENAILKPKEWIGGLFYHIITKKVDGKNVYCMFGVNDGNPISTKKFIDPLVFRNEGPQFGAPIFQVYDGISQGGKNRFVLEYKKGISISLNWDPEHKAILFDDLMSQINDPNRKYTFVPSGQYNGLIWENNRWNYVPNLIPVLDLGDGQAPSEVKKKGK